MNLLDIAKSNLRDLHLSFNHPYLSPMDIEVKKCIEASQLKVFALVDNSIEQLI